MSNIRPFKALRPDPKLAASVASRPYDVLNRQEARNEAQGNEHSFLHVTKSEIDLSDEIDLHDPLVYEKAKLNLKAFLENGTLYRDEAACYYIYRLVMGNREQTGLVCASSVGDYEQGIIKKHEFTRPEKEKDRIDHILSTGAHTGNVFLAYKSHSGLDQLIEKWKSARTPIYDFVAKDRIAHTIWRIDDPKTIEAITRTFDEEIPCTYIADGHHRAASAAKSRQSLGSNATPEADYFLTTLFPSEQLRIMDYNRAIKDLNGHSNESFLAALEKDFEWKVLGTDAFKPSEPHLFGMYLSGNWYELVAKETTYTTDPIGILDVTILQNNLLSPILGVKDPRTDKRIDFIGGIRGLTELSNKVDSGEMAVAFSLYPVSIQQLFDIADSGNVMPPKSTWFEPKLRDGLLTHLIH